MLKSLLASILWAAIGCELVTEPLYATGSPDSGPVDKDSGPTPEPDSGLDSGPELDSAPCVDADGDGACADRDCDDSNAMMSPDFQEYCPDHTDNDCDDLVDWADACDVTNDRCERPFAVLMQSDEERTVWQFPGLRLDTRYDDDYQAALSAGGGDCEPDSGQGGGDAVFQIVATADSSLEVTASAAPGGDPVLYLRQSCGASVNGDLCTDRGGQGEEIATPLRAGDEAYLFVDENQPGPVDLTVVLERR
ncbi:MAG: hypothetical protein HYY06_25765 [Deltaproteobacteria bacterium]|nr:hypothetical protein [Deltaproteobacteria bacterium]